MTTGITQGFRVIPEVNPKWVNNTNVHSKFTLISLFSKIHSLKSERIHSFLFREYGNEMINDNPDMSYRDRAIEPREEHLLRDGDIELGIEGVFSAVLYVHHDVGIAAPTRVQRRSRPVDQKIWWSWWCIATVMDETKMMAHYI